MRQVRCEALEREVSTIGFGCASLGSRVSVSAGMRALAQAFDNGVTWYDTAPPYGAGRAEPTLGSFIAGKRDKVVICTKVGIPRPPAFWPSLLFAPLARGVIKLIP